MDIAHEGHRRIAHLDAQRQDHSSHSHIGLHDRAQHLMSRRILCWRPSASYLQDLIERDRLSRVAILHSSHM